jgi:choline dehydrogenase
MESGGLLGHSYTLMTIDGSENIRDSASTAYIQPALEEDNNLILFPSTLAKRVVFNGTRAVAVDLDTMGRQYSLRARREVIISAGAFQSPQLLMVSGIGPSAKLAHHNIPVISELPGVGENMWDHILFGPSYRVNVITGSKTIQDPVFRAQQIGLFRNQRRGILTAPGGDILGWEHVPQRFVANYTEDIRADLASFPEDWPHIEYLFPGAVFGYAQNLPRDQPRDGYNYASVIGALVAPMSRGTVNIASRNTADPPLINPNWLTHPTDQAVAITAFKRAREIGTTRAMRNITIGQEFFPGLEVQTDAQILDLVSRALLPVSHAACTCRMGRGTDRMAVVDPHARVYGVQGLRVVDASSMPILVPGHPMATICRFGVLHRAQRDATG